MDMITFESSEAWAENLATEKTIESEQVGTKVNLFPPFTVYGVYLCRKGMSLLLIYTRRFQIIRINLRVQRSSKDINNWKQDRTGLLYKQTIIFSKKKSNKQNTKWRIHQRYDNLVLCFAIIEEISF